MSAVIVMRLRSRGPSSVRSYTSPNSTSSVSETSLGAKPPIIRCAALGCASSVIAVAPSPLLRPLAGYMSAILVLRIGDVLAPFGVPLGEGEVGHEVLGGGAVPVPLVA